MTDVTFVVLSPSGREVRSTNTRCSAWEEPKRRSCRQEPEPCPLPHCHAAINQDISVKIIDRLKKRVKMPKVFFFVLFCLFFTFETIVTPWFFFGTSPVWRRADEMMKGIPVFQWPDWVFWRSDWTFSSDIKVLRPQRMNWSVLMNDS